MLVLRRMLLFFLPFAATMAQSSITATTPVVSMLGMIPECSVPCVMEDLFMPGGCAMTNAQDLAACACRNITMQAELSTCVQKSCGFIEQNQVVRFASGLCAPYPKESRVDELKVASIATIVLMTLFLSLHLYSRWLKTQRLWSDDVYAIVAAVLLITVSIIILEMSLKGFGLHYWNVPTSNAVELLKLFYVCQMLYVAVQIFSKVAILALYSRLFPDYIRWFRWSVRGMIAFMYVHGLVFFLLIVFQCWPIRSLWDKTITGAKCLPVSVAIGFTGAALSIVEDIIILLLPLPVVWKLQMSTRKKIAVIFLISMGSFASVTSVIRLKFVVKYSNSYDSTWDNVDVIKWSLIEILAACICGNLLSLRPLIEQVMPPFRSVYGWYVERSSPRRSSEKPSWAFRSFGRFGRHGGSRKPRVLSTLYFTQMNLSPTSKPGWDWEKSTNSDQNTIVSPRFPTPARLEKHVGKAERDHVRHVPRSMVRKSPTRVLRSTETESTRMTSQTTMINSVDRTSEDGNNMGLRPSTRERENRISGPWSRAFAVLERH